MLKNTICRIGLVLSAGLILFISSSALVKASPNTEETNQTGVGPDFFYGDQSLNKLIDKDNRVVLLPGGARVEIKDNQATTYVAVDHLSSARVALTEDNQMSGGIDYTPFGDSQATGRIDVIGHYTGQVFERETATYDYHARRYDGSVGRFSSVDAIRKSISPYSYTENNPINKVDPNGLDDVPFFIKDINSIKMPEHLIGLVRDIMKILGGSPGQNMSILDIFQSRIRKHKNGREIQRSSRAIEDVATILGGASEKRTLTRDNRFYLFIGEGIDDVPVPDELSPGLECLRTFNQISQGEKAPIFAEEIVILDFSKQAAGRHKLIKGALDQLKDSYIVTVLRPLMESVQNRRTGHNTKLSRFGWRGVVGAWPIDSFKEHIDLQVAFTRDLVKSRQQPVPSAPLAQRLPTSSESETSPSKISRIDVALDNIPAPLSESHNMTVPNFQSPITAPLSPGPQPLEYFRPWIED